MSLGAPLALLALLLIPVMLLLERWRRRPRDLVVASLALWREIPGAGKTPPRRRRRRNLRLLLRIAALAFLALAGAGPALTATPTARQTLYVLVDRSPSMGASDRMERAMAIVADVGARFDRLRVLFSPPDDVRREGDSLEAPAPSSRGSRIERALPGLLSLVAGDPGSRALVVSDRSPEVAMDDSIVAVALVGETLPNAAVTALRVDRDADGAVVFAAWEAFGDESVAPALTLRFDGAREVRIPGGPGRRSAVRPLPAGTSRVTASLDPGLDALASDDAAVANREPGVTEFGLVTPGPARELQAALAAVLGDRLVLGGAGRDGGVSVGIAPPDDPPGCWIAVRPPTVWRGFRMEDAYVGGSAIAAVDVGVEDEVLAAAFPPGLSRDLVLGPAGRVSHPADARVLLRAPDGGALAATSADGRTTVLAFDPSDRRGSFARSGAHVVLWRALLATGDGLDGIWRVEGVLDAGESDLRGDARSVPGGFGRDAPGEVVVTTRSLRWLPGALAVLALLGLLLPGLLRGRR